MDEELEELERMFQHERGMYEQGRGHYPGIPPGGEGHYGGQQLAPPYFSGYNGAPRQILRNPQQYDPAYPLESGMGSASGPPPGYNNPRIRAPQPPPPPHSSYYSGAPPPSGPYSNDMYGGGASGEPSRGGPRQNEMFHGTNSAVRPARFDPTEVPAPPPYYGGRPDDRSQYDYGNRQPEWDRYQGAPYPYVDHMSQPRGAGDHQVNLPPPARPAPAVTDNDIAKFVEFHRRVNESKPCGTVEPQLSSESMNRPQASQFPSGSQVAGGFSLQNNGNNGFYRKPEASYESQKATDDFGYSRRPDPPATVYPGMNPPRPETVVEPQPVRRNDERSSSDGGTDQDICTFHRKVTQVEGEIGFAGADLFFQMSKVIGPVRPQKGDNVIVRAERVHAMPFDWNALSVEVISAPPERKLGSEESLTTSFEQIPLLLPTSQPSKPLKSILKNKPAPPPPVISAQGAPSTNKSSTSGSRKSDRSSRKRTPSPESPMILFENVGSKRSPSPKRRKLSPERKSPGPKRKSRSPVIIRKLSPPRGFSPPKLTSSHRALSPPPRSLSPRQSRRRSPTPEAPRMSRRRSPTPEAPRMSRRRSPTSESPRMSRRRSSTPEGSRLSRRRSPTPEGARLSRRRSPTPEAQRRSLSPVVIFRQRAPSPKILIRISPTTSPVRRVQPVISRKLSPLSQRRRSVSSSRSSSPRRRSPSPRRRRSPSPRGSPGRRRRRTPSPRGRRSVSPRSRRRSRSPYKRRTPSPHRRRRSRSSSSGSRERRRRSLSSSRSRLKSASPPKVVPKKPEPAKVNNKSASQPSKIITSEATAVKDKAKPTAVAFTWNKSLKDPPMLTGGLVKKPPVVKKPKPNEAQLPAYKVVEPEKSKAETLKELKQKIQVEKLLLAKEKIKEAKKNLKAAVATSKLEKKTAAEKPKPPPALNANVNSLPNVAPNLVPNPHFAPTPVTLGPQPFVQGFALSYQNPQPPFPPHPYPPYQEPFPQPPPMVPMMPFNPPMMQGPFPGDMFPPRPLVPSFEPPPVRPRPEIPAAQIYRTTMEAARGTFKGGSSRNMNNLSSAKTQSKDKSQPLPPGEETASVKKTSSEKVSADKVPNSSAQQPDKQSINNTKSQTEESRPAGSEKEEESQIFIKSGDQLFENEDHQAQESSSSALNLPEDDEIDDEYDVMDPSVAFELGCHPDKTSKARNWMICTRCAQRGHLIHMCDKQRIPRALPFEISQAKAMLKESKRQHLEEVARLTGETLVVGGGPRDSEKTEKASRNENKSEKSERSHAHGSGAEEQKQTFKASKTSSTDNATKVTASSEQKTSNTSSSKSSTSTKTESENSKVAASSGKRPSPDSKPSSNANVPSTKSNDKQSKASEGPRGPQALSNKLSQHMREKFEQELKMKERDHHRIVRPPRNRSAEGRDHSMRPIPSGSGSVPQPVFRISRRRSVSPSRTVIQDPMKAVAVKQLELHELELRDMELQKQMQILMIQRERMGFSGGWSGDNKGGGDPIPRAGGSPFCYVCLKHGHRGRDCFDSGPPWLRTRIRVREGTVIERMTGEQEPFCLACGKIGHFTRSCAQRKPWEVYSDDDS